MGEISSGPVYRAVDVTFLDVLYRGTESPDQVTVFPEDHFAEDDLAIRVAFVKGPHHPMGGTRTMHKMNMNWFDIRRGTVSEIIPQRPPMGGLSVSD